MLGCVFLHTCVESLARIIQMEVYSLGLAKNCSACKNITLAPGIL